MSPTRRSPHLAPGSALLVAVLLVLLALSSVLAYQAADAARSEARATDRALRGYASFATWELARGAAELLRADLAATLARAAARSDSPAALAAAARRELAWCRCDGAVLGAFRSAPGSLWSAELGSGVAASVRRIAESSRSAAADRVVIQPFTGDGRALVAVFARRADGVAAGFVADAAMLAPAEFDRAYHTAALLPPGIRAGSGEPVTAMVLRADGTVLWRSGPAAAETRDGWVDAKVGAFAPEPQARGTVDARLDGLFSGLVTRVAVRAEVAGAPDGAGSRLPLLLAVFGLTLGLVCVAIVQLRRQQELVRLRDDFVSGVSHELRTPLAQIRLFADLLESGRLPSAEQHARSVRIINEESRRLTWLVENILHFSRAQRGAGRVQPRPVQAAPLVREIVDAFAPLARAHGVTFEVRADEGVIARADPDALRQVLLNLLDNAVKYGPRGQTVRVRAELRGVALRISVDDAGPGVPWEDRAKVWEPYRRLARDAEGATGGSGIGLAVVKDLVELHGGRVGVGEVPGGGARFWIELPYAMHAGPSPEPAPAATEAAAR
jgi:signal transduction histidine kinase